MTRGNYIGITKMGLDDGKPGQNDKFKVRGNKEILIPYRKERKYNKICKKINI